MISLLYMEKTRTGSLQKNWSQSDGEEDETFDERRRKEEDEVSLPFCFVKIWPTDATPQDLFKDAIKMFKNKDPQHLQLSDKIRAKVLCTMQQKKYSAALYIYLERERVIGRLEDQRYHLRRFNLKIGEMASAKRSAPTEDEQMEKKKEEKKILEGKVKEAEKEFEEVKEAIWSHMDHLKEKHQRNEASVFILDKKKIRGKDRWFFMYCYLESIHTSITSMNTSSNTL